MILDQIVADKKKRLIQQKREMPEEHMKQEALSVTREHIGFYDALKRPGLSIIGECKKASPSMGNIKSKLNITNRIEEYNASVDAISCLTEQDHFCGGIEDLIEIRKKTGLPILRKDFMIDAYQFYEAKIIGADAVLLIAAILETEQMKEFYQLARTLGLDVLVEVHNEHELEKALQTGARIIGINNRNLLDFSISLDTTRNLVKRIPKDVVIVSESGILTDEDAAYLLDCGVDAFLVGRAFMEAEHPREVARRWKKIDVRR